MSRGIAEECPECGHAFLDPFWPSKVRLLFNLRQLPAMCRDQSEDVTGWGGACGCTNAAHQPAL